MKHGPKMPIQVSLAQMVDMAIGSPEVGAVNFNVLHTLLHAMLHKLNIQDAKAEVDEQDKDMFPTHTGLRAFSSVSIYSADSGKGEDSFSAPEDSLSDKSGYGGPKRTVPYHKLEKRVSELAKQMKELNELPSNLQLFSRALGKESERPVSDMWQSMQLKKRVDANEEGINKLASLVEDLMKEIKGLQNDQAELLDKLKGINLDDINKYLNALDNQFKELSDKYNELTDRLSNIPSFNDLDQYLTQFVTWPGLEDALKGIRQDFENLQPMEKVVIEMAMQTDTPEPKSRPTSARQVMSRASSAHSRKSSTGGPSNELLDLLERLGKLAGAHEELKLRVDELERLLELKANKRDLEGLGLSDDLLTTMKDLQEELRALKEGQIKDEVAISRLQEAIQKLQADIERLGDGIEAVITENARNVKTIQDLVQYCDNLNEKKADKEYVDMEVDVKADRRQLESKVNYNLFDSTTNELNRMIKDILDKLNGQDGDWKSALAKAMEELDGKLDRKELSNLKEWLEKQLKALNNKIKAMGSAWQFDDEAAGMKKQLIQRFHCLSCDKPVVVMPHPPIPSIPANYGLPKFKSSRPYTTFELDQIRQHARRHEGCYPLPPISDPQLKRWTQDDQEKKHQRDPAMYESTDYYATVRQCGGSHTLTNPQRKTTRLSTTNQLIHEEETIIPIYKEEVNVQGADGQIYKGRLNPAIVDAKLPVNFTSQQTHHVYMEKSQSQKRPVSAKVPHPTSGRPSSSQSRQHLQSQTGREGNNGEASDDNSQIGGSRTTTPQPEEPENTVDIGMVVEN